MIALINPPNPPGRVSNKDMMGGFGQCYPAGSGVKVPPMDLPYIAAVLKDSNVAFKAIDCLGSNLSVEDLAQILKETKTDLAFIRTSTPTFSWDVEVSKRLKEQVSASCVFFGPHVNVAPGDVIGNPYVDAIILGEAEYAVKDVALHGYAGTAGVWYKENGRVIRNKVRDYIEDLDALPFPEWESLPYMEYNVGTLLPDSRPTLFMQTSRGCPFKCSYCPYPVAQGVRYRKRSPQNVIDEFAHLAERYKVRGIVIRDAEFTLDRNRVVEICEGLIRLRHGVPWRCETRIDTLDEPLIELMHKAGCVGINMGIESKSEKVCRLVGRHPIDEADVRKIINKCRDLGIHTFCFFIIGLPGDDVKSVLETLEYAISLNADSSQFTVATPYLGTGLYEWALDNNYMESVDLDDITGYESMMRNENMTSRQIKQLRNEAQRLVDLIQSGAIEAAGEKLEDDRSLISLLRSLSFIRYYRRGIRRVVVLGTRGVSIPRIRKMGFEVLAVVDERQEGKVIDGRTVLHPVFIEAIAPDAVMTPTFRYIRSHGKKIIQAARDFLLGLFNKSKHEGGAP